MKLGIDNTLQVLDALKTLAIEAIDVAQKGVGLRSLGALMEIAKQAKTLANAARSAIPELGDLDADEAAKLASASFNGVKEILLAVSPVK